MVVAAHGFIIICARLLKLLKKPLRHELYNCAVVHTDSFKTLNPVLQVQDILVLGRVGEIPTERHDGRAHFQGL